MLQFQQQRIARQREILERQKRKLEKQERKKKQREEEFKKRIETELQQRGLQDLIDQLQSEEKITGSERVDPSIPNLIDRKDEDTLNQQKTNQSDDPLFDLDNNNEKLQNA